MQNILIILKRTGKVIIKEIVNIKSKNYNSPTSIEVGNSTVTNSSDICNNFKDYVSSIAESILKSDKHPILKSYDKYLTSSPDNSFVFEPRDPSGVNMLIYQLNLTKSSGTNGIPTKIMQMISNIICDQACLCPGVKSIIFLFQLVHTLININMLMLYKFSKKDHV